MNVKKQIILSVALFAMSIGLCSADNIPFYRADDKSRAKNEVPVTGDYDDSIGELALKFTESSTYTVEVYSEKALVYSARVTVDSYREVSVRVKSFDAELHTIVVTDSSGNSYEGDFFV